MTENRNQLKIHRGGCFSGFGVAGKYLAGVDRSGRGFNPRPAQVCIGYNWGMNRAFGKVFFIVALAFAAVALVRDGAAGETAKQCPNGLCEPVLLCPPWSTWDESIQQCRTVRTCPGESQVLITGGECELHCGTGREPDPFRPHHCRTAFQCPPDRVEIEPNVCEIPCPEGERQNPWRQGVCRKPFKCPFGRAEIAEGVCHNPCANGRVEISEGVCGCPANTSEIGETCAVPAAKTCGGVGMIYNPAVNQCEPAKECQPGTEAENGLCQSICRNRIIRTHYDPEVGGCVCPPGADGNNCRELDRSHATLATGVPFAHDQSLNDGTPLLGRGVVVAVTEAGPAHWIPNIADIVSYKPDSGDPVPVIAPTTHSELPDFPIFGYNPDAPTLGANNYDGTAQDAFHGVAVLGVMAAKKDGKGLAGIAPEADYLFANVRGTVGTYSLFENLTRLGADIFNHSWAPAGAVSADDFADPGGDLAKTRANLREYALRGGLGAWWTDEFGVRATAIYIDDIERGRFNPEDGHIPPADRPIHVWSTGNNHNRYLTVDINLLDANGNPLRTLEAGNWVNATVPSVLSGLPKYFPELTLNHLAVAAVKLGPNVAVVDNGVTLQQSYIADFSNRCGEGSESFCISAPGEALLGRPGWLNHIKALIVSGAEYDRAIAERNRKHPICASPGIGLFQIWDCNDYLRDELALQRFNTGYGSGIVLAPETDEYRQFEPRLPKGYDEARGTSFSAPVVSGALALMKQFFTAGTNCGAGSLCGLGSHELVARLLATADKRGIYADVSTYGAGLLDLENALSPQGDLMFFSGLSVGDSAGRLVSESALQTGPALGDAAANAMRGEVLAAFDAMRAPFPVAGESLIQSPSASGISGDDLRLALRRRIRYGEPALVSDWDFGGGTGWFSLRGGKVPERLRETIFGASNGGTNPYSALAQEGMTAGLEWDSFRIAMLGGMPGGDSRSRGMMISFSPQSFSDLESGKGAGGKGGAGGAGGSGGWVFHFGGIEESDGFLSSSGSGVFGGLRARTGYAGADYVGGDWDGWGGWRLRAGGFIGGTSAENNSGEWLGAVEDLRSESFHLGMERRGVWHAGDGLGFRVHQPLRVSEAVRIRIPTGRTRYGELTWREVSGEVSGRELVLEGLYRRAFEGGSWLLSAGAVSEPGHRAEAKTAGRILFAFEREF